MIHDHQEEDFGSRLAKFIAHTGLNFASFERQTGLSNGMAGKVVKKKVGLSVDKLNGIFNQFPELSPQWLITGKGEMLQSEVTTEPQSEQLSDLQALHEQAILSLAKLDGDPNDMETVKNVVQLMWKENNKLKDRLLELYNNYESVTRHMMISK